MKKLYYLLLVLMSLIWTGTTASAQEAYAALSEDNTVLTFYYDGNTKYRRVDSLFFFPNAVKGESPMKQGKMNFHKPCEQNLFGSFEELL